MKFGLRTPSLGKRITARTSPARRVRHSLGLKAPRGMGIFTNPKRAIYNRIYNRTTFGLDSLGRKSGRYGNVSAPAFLIIVSGLFLLSILIWLPVLIPLVAVGGYLFYANKNLKWPFSQRQQDRELLFAYKNYRSGKFGEALKYFLSAASTDASHAMFAAAILSAKQDTETQAIELLQGVVSGVQQFACPSIQKHNLAWELSINASPGVVFDLPMDKLGATLLLAKLYQNNGRIDEAISLVESIVDSANDNAVRIFLCELYAQASLNICQQQKTVFQKL